jgi:hypothetical protein
MQSLRAERIKFPMEDHDLPIKAPRPLKDENGVLYPTEPPSLLTSLGDIPASMFPHMLQVWNFAFVFGYVLFFSLKLILS